MSITVTPTYLPSKVQEIDGRFLQRTVLAVSGLTAGSANTVPHGLPRPPQTVDLNAGAAGKWGETQVADATNVYITVGSGGATSGWINVQY
ncbi:MAG: hypothetical protein WA542_19220 [Candidatus Acidiferrum sp.]